MSVHWTDYAEKNLDDLVEYIASRSSRRRGESQRNKIVRRARDLSFEYLGRAVPEYNDPALRQLIEGSYRIIYFTNLTDRRIDILTVHHSRQPLPQLDDLMEQAFREAFRTDDDDAQPGA